MRVKIGNYKSWFGPYQLAEKLCFWAKEVPDEYGFKNKPHWVHSFGEWLAHGSIEPDPKPGDYTRIFNDERPTTFLYKFLLWLDKFKQRKIEVHIDKWDTYSADHTLGLIILPLLKQLREAKQGAPLVDTKDVPEELRPTKEEIRKYKKDGTTDEKLFQRWDYVLGEMIFAFEHIVDDTWEEKFYKGKFDMRSVAIEFDEHGKPKMYQMVDGPNHTYECDTEALLAVQKRIRNGLILFGKYYQNLWT